jgi:D-amino peptidase
MKFKLHFVSLCTLTLFFISNNVQAQSSGILFSKPESNKDGKIKILLYYDMEGTSGQNDMKSLSFGNAEYTPVRQLLTDDVNAVIDGLFAGGADVVDVLDAHGSGNPEPDIHIEQLDSRAKMISKDKSFRPYCDLTEKDVYDAVAVVAMHSKTGGSGFAAHTYTIGMDWIFNDRSINETEIIAYSWGRADVPVIFASGDDKLKEQLEYMPWIKYVTVKNAKGASDAELKPLSVVHKDMQNQAKDAVMNITNAKVVKFTKPIKAQLRAVHPASLELLNGVPGINFKNNTVTFEAKNYQEAYDGIEALIGVATKNYSQLLVETIQKNEGANDIFNQFRSSLVSRWGDVESGRWSAPSSTRSRSNQKYFGVQ